MNPTRVLPRYDHDCQDCEFLGQFLEWDVYLCFDQHRECMSHCIILRKSSSPGDYWARSFSGEVFAEACNKTPGFPGLDRVHQLKFQRLWAALDLARNCYLAKYAMIGGDL